MEEAQTAFLSFVSPLAESEVSDAPEGGAFDAPPPPEMWERFQKRGAVEAVAVGERFTVLTPHGMQACAAGDYLVRDPDSGDLWGVNRKQFESAHVKLDSLGLPVENDEATTPAPPEPIRLAYEPGVERAALALAAEYAPRPVFDLMLIPVALPQPRPAHVVEMTLMHLESTGKIKREIGKQGAPSKFWSRQVYTATCERCGYTSQEVPPEGMPCPNCARSTLEPKEK